MRHDDCCVHGVCARVGARQESDVLHQPIKRKYGGRVQGQSSAATKRATMTMTMTMAMAMTKAMAMTTVTKTVTVTAHIIKSNPRQLAMLRSNAGTQARLQAGRHVRTTCAHEHTHAHTHTRTHARPSVHACYWLFPMLRLLISGCGRGRSSRPRPPKSPSQHARTAHVHAHAHAKPQVSTQCEPLQTGFSSVGMFPFM